MGTAKRERQKQGRQARIEAALEAQHRNRRRRSIRNYAILAVVIIVGAFLLSRQFGDDDDNETASTETSTTVTSGPTTLPPTTIVGATPCPATDGSAPLTTGFEGPPPMCIDPSKSYTATFDTSHGTIVVDLDETNTPSTVNNFVVLARYHYYDDTTIFRTDPGIGIIQGGSPHTETNSDPGPGYTIPDEGFDYAASGGIGPYTYGPGDLVMARSAGPNSSGAQFFFGVNDSVSSLDNQGTYLKFGTATEGLDVLQAILALNQGSGQLGGAPSEPVTINSVTITET